MKLNSDLRTAICYEVLEDALGQRKAALRQEYQEMTDEVYAHVRSKLLQGVESHLARLPREWLNVQPELRVVFGDERVSLTFSPVFFGRDRVLHSYDRVPAVKTVDMRPVPNHHFVFGARHQYTRRWQTWSRLVAQLHEEHNRLKWAVMGVLNKCGTLKTLLERWPEVEPYITDDIKQKGGVGVPAIPVDEVNAQLAAAKKGGDPTP